MTRLQYVFLLLVSFIVASRSATLIQASTEEDELWPLAIIHLNDFHARFEETNPQANTCKDGEVCIGGYARVVTKVKELQAKYAELAYHPIYLNAGDSFQGTLWYNVLRWNVTAYFMNEPAADVMVSWLLLASMTNDHARLAQFKSVNRSLGLLNAYLSSRKFKDKRT